MCGVRDRGLQHRLFEKVPSLTFKKASNMALVSEVSQQSVTEVQCAAINSAALYSNNKKSNMTSLKQNNTPYFKRKLKHI